MITTKKFYVKKFLSDIDADGPEHVAIAHQWGGDDTLIVGYGARIKDQNDETIGHHYCCLDCAPPGIKERAEAETSLDINACDPVFLFDEYGQREYICFFDDFKYKCDDCGKVF